MPWAIPQLDILIAFVVALGVCILVAAFARAFFGTLSGAVGWLPFFGKVAARSLIDIEQKITSVMGRAVIALEKRIGSSWHSTARLFDHIGREIASHARLLQVIAELLPGVAVIERTIQLIRLLQAQARALEHRLAGLGHDVLPRVKVIERGIGADVLPRIRGLEREIDGVIVRDIPGLRTGDRVAEREITNLWKWTRTHTLQAGTIAFAGAVVLALRRLGLGWLRCNSLGNIGRSLGCSGFGLIEDFLALGLEIVVVADICQIADAIESAAILVEPELDKLVGLSDFICRAGGASFPSGIVASDTTGRGGNPSALIAADIAA